MLMRLKWRGIILRTESIVFVVSLASLLGCGPSKLDVDAEGDGPEELGPALPLTWDEYRVDDRFDDVECTGVMNETAVVSSVFFAQTHPMETDWPFFYLVADRPALAEVVVTGEGLSPEVSVTAFVDGE